MFSFTSMRFSRTTKSTPSIWLTSWLTPTKNSNPNSPYAKTAKRLPPTRPSTTASPRMPIFATTATKTTIPPSWLPNIIKSRFMKNLKNSVFAPSMTSQSWSCIAVFALRLCVWTVRFTGITLLEKWVSISFSGSKMLIQTFLQKSRKLIPIFNGERISSLKTSAKSTSKLNRSIPKPPTLRNRYTRTSKKLWISYKLKPRKNWVSLLGINLSWKGNLIISNGWRAS